MSGLRPRSALRKSQQTAYKQIMGGPATMLWLDMGSGKTGTSLTAIRDLLDWGYAAHVLVIAPLLVAERHGRTKLRRGSTRSSWTTRCLPGTLTAGRIARCGCLS